MSTNKEIKELCRAFSRGFDEVEGHIMDWGRNKKDLKKPIRQIMDLDINPRYPEGYGNMSAGNFLISLVLTDPKAIKRLRMKHEAVLVSNTIQVLSFWEKNPGFWCYFSIKEKLQDDFLTIVDLLSGEEHLLYSSGISGMQKSGESRNRHYLCLMLDNGECLQTAGILRYNSLSVSDFLFYCGLFAPEKDLDSILNTHYSKFFMLDEISTLPVVMHRGNQVLYTWQPFTLENFDITSLGGKWSIKEKGSQISYSLEKPDETMMEVPHGDLLELDFPAMSFTLYRDTSTASMAINTTSLISYSIIAALLTRSYPTLVLPKDPEVAISMALFSLLSHMDLDLPWSRFQEVRDSKEEVQDESFGRDDMAKTNALLRQYMQALNSGKSFDAHAYSKKSGLPLEMVEDVIQSLQNVYTRNMPTFEVPAEDAKYELSGWPVPPPATRRHFTDSLGEVDFFVFDEGPNTLDAFNALTKGLYKDDFFDIGLLEFIEDMFLETFDDDNLAYTLANSFLWILFYKGRQWVPVRSYTIEMLKLFPFSIKEAYPDAETFIETFSTFTKKVLCPKGICSLSARPKIEETKKGTYTIKGSEAFYSLVEGINT